MATDNRIKFNAEAIIEFNGISIPRRLLALSNSRLSLGAKILYGKIYQLIVRYQRNEFSYTELGEYIGTSSRQTGRYVGELEQLGVIEIERGTDGTTANRYYLTRHKLTNLTLK